MSADEDVEPSLRDWRELSATQKGELREAVVRRARRMRSEMAKIIVTAVASALVRAAKSLVASISRLNKFYIERVAIASLRKLDDAALRDIGIRRGEIESIVQGQGTDDTRRQRASDISPVGSCDRSLAA